MRKIIECPVYPFTDKTDFVDKMKILKSFGKEMAIYKANPNYGPSIDRVIEKPDFYIENFDCIIEEPYGICFSRKGHLSDIDLSYDETWQYVSKEEIVKNPF